MNNTITNYSNNTLIKTCPYCESTIIETKKFYNALMHTVEVKQICCKCNKRYLHTYDLDTPKTKGNLEIDLLINDINSKQFKALKKTARKAKIAIAKIINAEKQFSLLDEICACFSHFIPRG